ncbi:MAG: hypothetical protein JW973_06830 [Bacteroidales bacterium]|nr:hypothetical protein [Bacteroidales bacterium]
MDDIAEIVIYILIAVVGLVASAFKNRNKNRPSHTPPPFSQVPRNMTPQQQPEAEPDLGPLMDLLGIPRQEVQPPAYESIEEGPTVEEAGMNVEAEAAAAELAGYQTETSDDILDKPPVVDTATFEEGQSDIQKLLAKYESNRKAMEGYQDDDDIAAGEILSVEATEANRLKAAKKEPFFDARKAIIYSEILKRKEF